MQQGQGKVLGTSVDIVFVIDKTGSMQPVIDKVKALSQGLHKKLSVKLTERGRPVESLRTKVISFGDFSDGPDAIQESDFFKLPDQESQFVQRLNDITAEGGGDDPENGLEALFKAINTPWIRNKTQRQRHIIVLFSDAPAKPLRLDETLPGYPTEVPATVEELSILWDQEAPAQAMTGMVRSSHRLCVFAPPHADSWDKLKTWHKSKVVTIDAANGGADIDEKDILAFLVDSASDV